MKIVIATPLYPPEIGGPATYVKLLEEGLPKEGVEIDVVKFSDVRHLPKIIRHYAYYRRVVSAARHADAVLALDPVSVGLPAMCAARKLKKPFVVKIVGDYAWEQGQQRFGVTENLDEFVKRQKVPFAVRMLRRIQTRVARNAKHVIVPSEYLKDIVTSWGVASEKIEVIYNAISLEKSGAVPEMITKLSRPLVVTSGRLVPWKNIEGVIDAVASISGASLVVIGDGPLRTELERHAAHKIPGRVVFTGMLSHEDALATMQSANVLVLNSTYEGLSHLLIEAQALGVPTVATRVGGNPEVITSEEDGLLVPSGDTSALTQALERLLADRTLQEHFSQGMAVSAKRFSTETMLQGVARVFRNL